MKHSNIHIGKDIIGTLQTSGIFSSYSKVVVITDITIKKVLLRSLNNLHADLVITIPSGETAKNIQTVQQIWKQLLQAGVDRKSIVVNIGGGVVGDIGGFAASTFMRGIDFINVPTTLLSQVDASIGGKTGIDFAGIKNLVGTFTQPKAVIIDVSLLSTLPKREFVSGFAEVIKHGLIKDKTYFEKVTSKKPLQFSQDELVEIIRRSCEIKEEIVQHDETEKGERKLLNFGHTIGHAIEAMSLETNKPLLHGEAISIGMVLEAQISELLGMISKNDVQKIEKALENAELPISVESIDTNKVLEKLKADKKNEKGKTRFTLLKKIGEAIIDQEVSGDVIRKVLVL